MLRTPFANTLAVALLNLLLIAGCTSLSTSIQQEPEVNQSHGQPSLYVWPNRNSHSNNEATIALVVKAGSLQEEESERGYAHFVEHMAFNGTESFPGALLQQRLNSLGFDIGRHSNAYTSFDRTVYTLQLNAVSPERIEAAMEMLSQWAFHIEFDSEQVAQERSIILQEWRQKTDPDRVESQLNEDYFSSSRFNSRPPIGTSDGIQSATAEGLSNFYDRWYHPDNMAVIVTGDIDASHVKDLFKQYFPIREGSSGAQPIDYRVMPMFMADYLPVTDPYVINGTVSLNYYVTASEVLVEQNLLDLLAWQAGLDIWLNRVDKRIVDTKGAVKQAAYSWDFLRKNQLKVQLSTTLGDSDFRTGLTLLEEERMRLSVHGISESELNDWRQRVLNHEKSQQDSAKHLANEALNHYMEQWPMVGQKRWVTLLEQHLPKLTTREVSSAFAQITATRPKIRLVYPQSSAHPPESQVYLWLASARTAAQALKTPLPDEDSTWLIAPQRSGAILTTKQHSHDVTEWVLDNGMSVFYRYSNQAPGRVYYTLSGLGGLNGLSEQEIINARLALTTLGSSGLREMDGGQLNEWLTNHAMVQQPYFSFFDRGMKGSGLAVQFPTMMRLLHIALTEGRVDSQVWQQVKSQNRSQITKQNSHPHHPWRAMLGDLIYQDDIALRPLTIQELNTATPMAMEELYNRLYAGAQNYRLAIVGDIDRETARQEVVNSIATLPIQNGFTPPTDFRPYPSPVESASRRIAGKGGNDATVVLLYSLDKTHLNLDSTYPLNLLQRWIHSELVREIREEAGLVYSLDASIHGLSPYRHDFALVISAKTAPETTKDLVDAIETTLTELSRVPPNESRIEQWNSDTQAHNVQYLNRAKNQAQALATAPIFGKDTDSALITDESSASPPPNELAALVSSFLNEEAIRLELIWTP